MFSETRFCANVGLLLNWEFRLLADKYKSFNFSVFWVLYTNNSSNYFEILKDHSTKTPCLKRQTFPKIQLKHKKKYKLKRYIFIDFVKKLEIKIFLILRKNSEAFINSSFV